MEADFYRFAKQFVLSDKVLESATLDGWNEKKVFNGMNLYFHPRLKISTFDSLNRTWMLLGDIFDPECESASNEEILQELDCKIAHSSNSFIELEEQLFRLSGRWLLFVKFNNELRAYPDASGLKPLYYVKNGDDSFVLASQPALLESLGFCCKHDIDVQSFLKLPHGRSWPVGYVPYSENVTQLQANHYLKIPQLESKRFWPVHSIENIPLSVASQKMNQILKGTIKAISHRYDCTLSLSGGYDSRLLFSCVLDIKDRFQYFTTISDYSPDNDIEIPKLIAREYGLRHQFTKKDLDSTQESILTILENNVGGLYHDRSVRNLFAFKQAIQNTVHLPGSVSEISRCYYSPYGKRLLPLSGKRVAAISGFKGNHFAEAAFSKWIESLPKNLGIEPLDLLYWEHRLGVWSATGLTYREGLIDQIPPMNNREYMTLALSVDMKHRLLPHNLIRNIIGGNDPKLLSWLFNGKKMQFFDSMPKIKYIKERIIDRLFS
ncbi:hypothetical protein [Pseudoalteromonas xiamenensis]